jgi:hypothetical protein
MLHCHLPHHMMNQMISMVGPLMAGHQPAGQRFPGFPQDMFMNMDEMFKDKPETHGLAPGWTGGMMGMMTLVRVLEPALFDRIEALRRERSDAEVAR